MVVDAPSDQWATFWQQWRETPRYGADVGALLAEAARKYGLKDWTLTASVFVAGRNGPGLSRAKYGELKSDLLFVHHADDPCQFMPYREAQAAAKASGKPLVTVRGGGGWKGGLCEAFTAHGFAGAELAALRAMRVWIRTGQAPEEVSP